MSQCLSWSWFLTPACAGRWVRSRIVLSTLPPSPRSAGLGDAPASRRLICALTCIVFFTPPHPHPQVRVLKMSDEGVGGERLRPLPLPSPLPAPSGFSPILTSFPGGSAGPITCKSEKRIKMRGGSGAKSPSGVNWMCLFCLQKFNYGQRLR